MSRLAFAAALMMFAIGSAQAAQDRPRQWTDHWAMNLAGVMKYSVYVPQSARSTNFDGIILGLHGCQETAADFAALSRMTDLAEKHNVILVFPEQSPLLNIDRCWNWFEMINQWRNTGEPSLIMTAFNETVKSYSIDRSQAFIIGVSAGGAMANIVASCNPEVFSGAAILSGIDYAYPITLKEIQDKVVRCPSVTGAASGDHAFACSGLNPRSLPNIILFHGDQDPYVYPCNEDFIFDQWVRMADWADDLKANDSVNGKDADTSNKWIWGKQTFTQKDFATPTGWRIRQVMVNGMSHAWSGGTGNWGDPDGPDATEMIWDFFTDSNRGR